MAGWGRSSGGPGDFGDLYKTGVWTSSLQELKVPLVSNDECQDKHDALETKLNQPAFNLSGSHLLCAGGEAGDGCSI